MSSGDAFTQQLHLSGLDLFIRPLTITDIPSCLVVEATFPEHERCSEEKFFYRFAKSPELSLGLFVGSDGPVGGPRLIGHVIGIRSAAPRITDGSMLMPEQWQSMTSNEPVVIDGQVIGYDARGRTVAVHSVVILPDYQGKKLGKTLVEAYIQYIQKAHVNVDRIVLIAHEHRIHFYESVGFVNHGIGACTFGGDKWTDLVVEF